MNYITHYIHVHMQIGLNMSYIQHLLYLQFIYIVEPFLAKFIDLAHSSLSNTQSN